MDDAPAWGQDARVLQWLDPSTNHSIACKRKPMTGNWLIESREFASRKTYIGRFLLLHSIPRCGKTILCSTVIEHVKNLCTTSKSTTMHTFALITVIRKTES